MLITKTNPKGIDYYVQQLQTKLHTQLLAKWGINSNQYKAYGRCHRNKTDDGYTAENYEGTTAEKEYKEVYWDDSLTVSSFFGISAAGIKAGTTNSQADMHIVFFADLKKLALKDSDNNVISHRADEELRTDVLAVIGKSSYGFTYTGTELWLENVLREYPGSRRDDRLKYIDMHPIHCFRINLKLNYNPNILC